MSTSSKNDTTPPLICVTTTSAREQMTNCTSIIPHLTVDTHFLLASSVVVAQQYPDRFLRQRRQLCLNWMRKEERGRRRRERVARQRKRMHRCARAPSFHARGSSSSAAAAVTGAAPRRCASPSSGVRVRVRLERAGCRAVGCGHGAEGDGNCR